MSDEGPPRVFITGASGFIGRTLAAHYRAAGWDVTGVDAVASEDGAVVAGDIATPGPWQDHVDGAELVIHTAAVVSNTASRDRCWEVNVLGTRRVLDAARDHHVTRFVHLSSVRAFSDRDFPTNVDEAWPVRTDGHAYVDTKVASEQVVLQAHAAGEVAVTIVRPGDVYGPASRPWTILPVEAIAAGRFLLPARGRGVFSPIYVDDLVTGIVAAARHPDGAGQVFILTGDETPTCAEFFGHYGRMLNRRILTAPTALARASFATAGWLDRARRRPTEATADAIDYFLRRSGYSNRKARAVLGWQPSIDVTEGMTRTQAWLAAEGYLDRA